MSERKEEVLKSLSEGLAKERELVDQRLEIEADIRYLHHQIVQNVIDLGWQDALTVKLGVVRRRMYKP